jgi:hypothetical protein
MIFLSLIPAAIRGPHYVAKSGTPWPWPLFPWSAFFVLAVAVGIRSYALSHSFNVLGWHCTFSGYFLVPLLFAALIVWSELAFQLQSRRGQWAAVAAAPLLLLLSVPLGEGFYFLHFLRTSRPCG